MKPHSRSLATAWFLAGLAPWFAAPPAAIVTVPVNIPADRPAGFTETLRLAGVAAVPGVTASQPTGELAVALRLRVGPLLTTDTLCAAGVAPPIW